MLVALWLISLSLKWDKANWLSLMLIKRSLFDTICDGIWNIRSANNFMDAIREKFKESERQS